MTSGKPKNPSQALTALLTAGAPARSSNAGIVAVVVLGVTLVVLALLAAPLLRVSRSDIAAGDPKTLNQDEAAARFDETMTRNLAQIEGRSAFYLPLKNSKVEVVEDRVAPRIYGGPQIVAMVNNAVWFAGGERVDVGKTDKSGDLKVLAINAPWSAKVRWQGGEFTVEFFQRSPLLTGKTEGWKSTFVDDGPRPPTPKPASAAGAPAPQESTGFRARARAEGQDGEGPSVVIEIPAMEEPSHDTPPATPAPAPRPQPPATPAAEPGSNPEPAPSTPPPANEPPPADPEKQRP